MLSFQIHKKLGGTHIALTNFSWAMDLDPKGTNNHIKETINKRYIVDEEGITPGRYREFCLHRCLEFQEYNA